MSEQPDGEDTETDKKVFGCLAKGLGCAFDGCFTLALPSVLIALFLFLR